MRNQEQHQGNTLNQLTATVTLAERRSKRPYCEANHPTLEPDVFIVCGADATHYCAHCEYNFCGFCPAKLECFGDEHALIPLHAHNFDELLGQAQRKCMNGCKSPVVTHICGVDLCQSCVEKYMALGEKVSA